MTLAQVRLKLPPLSPVEVTLRRERGSRGSVPAAISYSSVKPSPSASALAITTVNALSAVFVPPSGGARADLQLSPIAKSKLTRDADVR